MLSLLTVEVNEWVVKSYEFLWNRTFHAVMMHDWRVAAACWMLAESRGGLAESFRVADLAFVCQAGRFLRRAACDTILAKLWSAAVSYRGEPRGCRPRGPLLRVSGLEYRLGRPYSL